MVATSIVNIRHQSYVSDSFDWELWRDCFEGGRWFRDRYLQHYPKRETSADFELRRQLSPIPTFAKAAIIDLRNSIFQRLTDVTRTGGTDAYQRAIVGKSGGMDGKGATANSFFGKQVLTELLVMGKCGVYVDAAPLAPTLLSEPTLPPFLSHYPVEDILSYTLDARGEEGQFKAVFLRDRITHYNQVAPGIQLPDGAPKTQYRMVYKTEFGDVVIQLYDEGGAEKGDLIYTGLKSVPFVLLDIDDSLMKDVCSYQIALLNLASSDVDYALRSNFPFLTIQTDGNVTGAHLKQPGGGSSDATGKEESLGTGRGRYYGVGEERPGFISPSVEPLTASMNLQESHKDSIRELINLAVQSKKGTRTESAEAKKLSSEGLDAGLSFIGLVLQLGEQTIAKYWAETENTQRPEVPTIAYPTRYILKTDEERTTQAGQLLDLMYKIPGRTVKKTVNKLIVSTLLGGKESKEVIDKLHRDIEGADFTTSDTQMILSSHERGLVDDKTASIALGFTEGLVVLAQKDRAARAVAILAAQTAPRSPSAAGVPELGGNPGDAETEQSKNEDQVE